METKQSKNCGAKDKERSEGAKQPSKESTGMAVSSDEYAYFSPEDEETGSTLRVWYRHSGEEEIPPTLAYKTFKHEGKIAADIGNHHITHMAIKNGVIPNLDVIAPKLTHLKIQGVNQFSQLQRMTQLPQLRVLDLSGNYFPERLATGLSAVIGEINSLNELHLDHCNLTTLPESMSQLSQLRKLDLSGNNFSAGLPAVIGEINSLNVLNLSGCKLTTLPESISQLSQLTKLDLSGNNFSAGLPAVIGEINSLNVLTLSGCRLTTLPESISQLSQLTKLNLAGNNFSAGLPTVIGEINSLNELCLSGCKLTTLPESTSKLPHLRKLNLTWNSFFAGLPAVIGEINSLNRLYLGYSQLTTLPNSMSQLSQLRILDISNNNFSAGLPAFIGEINSLNELHLWCCCLMTLPESMSQLSQLRVLNLSGNYFTAGLPAVIGEIISLNELSLGRCKLTTLPDSLSQLTQLRVLNLYSNDFSAGLPAVIGEINSLNELRLGYCNLTTLPDRLHNLKMLEVLRLQDNKFEQLPSVIFKLTELKTLNVHDNPKLKRIDDDFLHLTNLTHLDCRRCHSLVYPPYAACEQGFEAVRKFLIDIRSAKGIERTVVPVAIIGQSMSGKSSLVQSLKTGKRTLTYRETNSPLDETTKVFQVEDLHLPSSQLKLIDFGGNEVYHIAYRMMIKEQYLPLVVVNLEEFSTLSSTVGPKEASRKVCLDWLAHLYLACPRLRHPILVITHVDRLSSEDVKTHIKELLKQAEVIRQNILDEERVHQGSFQEVVHLSNTQIPLFAPDDIFEFGSETTTTSNIQSLKNNLEERSKEFNVLIPRVWEELASSVHGHSDTPYVSVSDITSKYSGEDCLVILRYMHNIGDILWFENIDGLRGYLFHQLPAITKMVTVLFHHCSEDQWKTRLAKFTPFLHDNQLISEDKYRNLADDFISSGVIEKSLLIHLLETESKFPSEVALELLKCFCIVHGPIKKKCGDAYVIPFFAPDSKDDSWKSDGPLQLRLDIILRGLTLPKYVHQLLTVTVLNQTLSSTNTIEVANNGTTVYHGENTTHLIHDFMDHKVTLQISTPVDLLADSWKRLIDTAKPVVSLLAQEWKACHASFKFYCSHCLFLKDPNPDFDVNPSWFSPVYDYNRSNGTGTSVHTESFHEIQPVTCRRDAAVSKSKKPTVPKPLRFPCYELSVDETRKLESYLSDIELSSYQMTTDVGVAVGETRFKLETRNEQEEDSELSDVEEQGYCDPKTNAEIFMKLKSVKRTAIRKLYRDPTKVYLMSDKVRGRVLIINIRTIQSKQQYCGRDGSDIDYINISKLFTEMRFDVVKDRIELTDLTAEEIYREIREESNRKEHKDLGMFVLVLMSIGKRGDILLDCKGQPVDLVKVKDLLSPLNFPDMKGKPKLIILQACSGDRCDYGDAAASPPSTTADVATEPPSTPTEAGTSSLSITSADPTDSAIQSAVSAATVSPGVHTTLNVDDFFIMKPSNESYIAVRCRKLGSWFIRMLVITFYNHAHSKDIGTLFEIIQQRVRKLSLTDKDNTMGGNVPTSTSTLTDYKKLYLFPGYPSLRR